MTITLTQVKTFIKHYQWTVVFFIAAIGLGLWVIGCESTTTNPFNPIEKVTRVELNTEVDHYLAKVDLAYEDLNKQDLIKQKISEIALNFMQGGAIDPVGTGIMMLGLLGVGATIDNRRKDTVIKTLKNNVVNSKEVENG